MLIKFISFTPANLILSNFKTFLLKYIFLAFHLSLNSLIENNQLILVLLNSFSQFNEFMETFGKFTAVLVIVSSFALAIGEIIKFSCQKSNINYIFFLEGIFTLVFPTTISLIFIGFDDLTRNEYCKLIFLKYSFSNILF